MKISLICFLFALAMAGCGDEVQKPAGTESRTPDTVSVFLLKTAALEKMVSLPGELLSFEVVEIHPKVAGYIKDIKVDIGSRVRKGQVLAILDAPEIESRMAESSSHTQSAKSKYEASKDTYDRILIASRSDGVIAPNELERSKNQMLADSAELAAATFASRSSRQVGNYLVIVAPFSGTITERNIHPGSFAGGQNEKPILVIEDNSKLRLRVSVPEALSMVALKGNSIRFSTKSDPNGLYEGKLSRKSGSIDASTRTEIWEFDIKNEQDRLKPGTFADVKLNVSRTQPSFVVPSSAIATTLEKKFVARVKNGMVEWVDISQGLNQSDSIEIFGKLMAGDSLVLKGNEELKPGTRVVTKLSK